MAKYEVRELAYLIHRVEADSEEGARQVVYQREKNGHQDIDLYSDDESGMIVELVEEPLMTSDTARVEACLLWLAAYDATLNVAEVAPNGDDYNRLSAGCVSILRDGVRATLPNIREEER